MNINYILPFKYLLDELNHDLLIDHPIKSIIFKYISIYKKKIVNLNIFDIDYNITR